MSSGTRGTLPTGNDPAARLLQIRCKALQADSEAQIYCNIKRGAVLINGILHGCGLLLDSAQHVAIIEANIGRGAP